MIRRVLLSAVSGVALASSAFGADIYSPGPASYAAVALPPNWSGFYLGANGGYAGNNSLGFREDLFTSAATGAPTTPYSSLRGSDTIAGGFGGGQLGYNFQLGTWLIGFETDIQGSNIQGSGASTIFNTGTLAAAPTTPFFCGSGGGAGGVAGKVGPYPGVCAAKHDLDVDYFGTVRGRLGYVWGGVLLYATGGFAYGGVDSHFGYTDNSGGAAVAPFVARASNNNTRTGWSAGGGIEYKISPSWSLKGEYQFVDLGSNSSGLVEGFNLGSGTPVSTCTTPTTAGCTVLRGKSDDVAFNTVRVGVNYFFNTPYEPLK